MSPVDQSRNHVGRAASVTLVAIVVLGGAMFLAAKLISPKTGLGEGKVQLGDATFQGGSAERLSKEIAKGGPIFYGDVSGNKERDIILQHIGNDTDSGWYAFRAAPANKDRDCTWTWQPDEEIFRARCDESLTAPADGKGLQRYPVKVVDGRLDVDLNAEARTATTTTTTAD
ncbi:MAG: hypothetical protein KDA95_06655 [Acidimicrobiales bacterium]|nr:hypothetical protein [Acidimicrobiales bacterium]